MSWGLSTQGSGSLPSPTAATYSWVPRETAQYGCPPEALGSRRMSPVQVLGAVELRYPIPTSAQSPGCPTPSRGSRRRWRRWRHDPLRVPLTGLIPWEPPLGQRPWLGPGKALVWAWDWRWSDPPGSRRGVSRALWGLCAGRRESQRGSGHPGAYPQRRESQDRRP